MQTDFGFMVNKWPKILGSDIAGEVHEIGANVTRFKKGDRVAAITLGMVNEQSDSGAFQLYTKVSSKLSALIPSTVPFKDGAVLGMAVNTAACGLGQEGYLELPYPNLETKSTGKVTVVWGGSTSIGSMATQLAVAAGIRVIATASPKNFELCRECGASDVFDYKDSHVVDDVVKAVGDDVFAGVYVAVSNEESYKAVLPILEKLGGGNMVTSLPPPDKLPYNVQAKGMFGPGEHSAQVWQNFITEGLQSGKLKCLPKSLVVGKGLEALEDGVDQARAGVSAQKLVVEL
jgi:NADPH:quinone reductase-like Zn-dependent oxidoreductase